MQDYPRHDEQQSHCRKVHAKTAEIHLTTFKKCASLLLVLKTLQEVRIKVRAMH